MPKRKTKDQFISMLIKHIDKHFGGNQAEAARKWDEERTTVNAVIGGHRNPTKKIVKALGYIKDTVDYYVEEAS